MDVLDNDREPLITEGIQIINKLLNNGVSYTEAFTQFAYSDCPIGNLALLIVAEERFNVSITSAKQWQAICQISPEHMDWVEDSFVNAVEHRYTMALNKISKKRWKVCRFDGY